MKPIKPPASPRVQSFQPSRSPPAHGGKAQRSPSAEPVLSQGSSELSADTHEDRVGDLRARSHTPASAPLLPKPASLRGGPTSADVNPQLLSKARRAVDQGGGMAFYRPGDSMKADSEDAGTYRLAAGRDLRPVQVAELAARSERREPKAERLDSILKAIGTGQKLPPIKIDATGGILDGFHRLRAAELVGIKEIMVEAPERQLAPAEPLHQAKTPWRPRNR